MRNIKIGYIDTVHGECPHCHENTLLVAIVTDFYKCTMCGEETRQYVNGSIKYLKLDDRDREFIEKRKELDKKMAKKKPMFGVNNYHKRTPRKRPGRIRKKMGPGQKDLRGIEARGVSAFLESLLYETHNDHSYVSYVWWRHQIRYF